jgi:glutamine cyclotransferase
LNQRVYLGSRILELFVAAGLAVSCAGNAPIPATLSASTAQPIQPPVAASPPPALQAAGPIPVLQTPPASLSSPVVASPSPSVIPASLTPAPNYGYKVVHAFSHDPMAFTEGLIFEGGFIYESTGLEGRSSLRKTQFETGRVLQLFELPDDIFGEGLTAFGDRLIQLTWKSQLGYVYDKATFQLLREFTYPTEGWGLTQDGKNLIMSDGTANIYFLDPLNFERVRQIEVVDAGGPVTQLNELEYVRGEIYANIWTTDRIARIDPKTGRVLGWIDLTGLLNRQPSDPPVDVLNGIAYDAASDRLFVTGKLWPKLYEITLIPPR